MNPGLKALKFIFCVAVFLSVQRVAEAIEYKSITDFYLHVSYHDLRENLMDANNEVLGLPLYHSEFLIRQDLRLFLNPEIKIILRPYLIGSFDQVHYRDRPENVDSSKGEVLFSDAFAEVEVLENWSIACGIQTYQWGPAELFTPSNPLFHLNTQSQTFFYRQRGAALIRSNFTWTQQFSLVLIAEPLSNGEDYWIAERNFTDKYLMKAEYQFKNPANYVGLVGGTEELHQDFVGEYLQISPIDGLSFYLDARQTHGNSAYYPILTTTSGLQMQQDPSLVSKWTDMTLVGVRIESEYLDARGEYIHNGIGLQRDNQVAALATMAPSNPFAKNNFQKLAKSGRELTGIHYSYWSLRSPNMFKVNDLSLALRYLHSHGDSTGILQTSLDGVFGSAWNWYFLVQNSVGDSNGELGSFEKASYTAGFKYTY